jgi:hypothetical protein
MEKLKHLKKFDILSKPPELNVNGSSGVETYTGSFLSLVYVGTIVFVIFNAFRNYLDDTSPTVTQNFVVDKESPRINFLENSIYPLVMSYYRNESKIEMEKQPYFFTARLNLYSYTYNETIKDWDNKQELIELVPCRDSPGATDFIHKLSNNKIPKESIDRHGKCIPIEQRHKLFVEGSFTSLNQQYAYLEITPCSEAVCANATELSNIYFVTAFPQTIVDSSRFNEPVSVHIENNDIYHVNPASKTQNSVKLREYNIRENYGFPYPETKRFEGFEVSEIKTKSQGRDPSKISCTRAEFLNLNTVPCQSYLNIEFIGNGNKVVYTRTYKGIIETLADIGGMKEIVYIIVFLIYQPFYKRAFSQTIMDKLFAFNKGKQKGFSKKKLHQNGPAKTFSEVGFKEKIWFLFVCRCCKKRTKQDEIDEEVRQSGMESLEETLDVLQLARQMNCMKVLTNILFKAYQYKLIPLMALNLFQKRKIQKTQFKKRRTEARKESSSSVSRVHPSPDPTVKEEELVREVSEAFLDYDSAVDKLIERKKLLEERRHETSMREREQTQAKSVEEDSEFPIQGTLSQISEGRPSIRAKGNTQSKVTVSSEGRNPGSSEDKLVEGFEMMIDDYCYNMLHDSPLVDISNVISAHQTMLRSQNSVQPNPADQESPSPLKVKSKFFRKQLEDGDLENPVNPAESERFTLCQKQEMRSKEEEGSNQIQREEGHNGQEDLN